MSFECPRHGAILYGNGCTDADCQCQTSARNNNVVIRPGPGWKRLGGAVFERADGLRVHIMGLCRLPDGSVNQGLGFTEQRLQAYLIKINGGNRKRGMMAWAATVAKQAV